MNSYQTLLPHFKIHILKALKDNYIYVLYHDETKEALIIDPSESQPVIDLVQSSKLNLKCILNTHHHYDHIGGNQALCDRFKDVKVIAPKRNLADLPRIDQRLPQEELNFELLGLRVQSLPVPGHTLGHTVFYFPDIKVLFSGDTLFLYGCGRMFEGTPDVMWQSLKRLRDLPSDTQIFCGHEYTLANLNFALSLEPDSMALKEQQHKAEEMLQTNGCTIPQDLKTQIQLNPFLRADDVNYMQTLNSDLKTPVETFAFLREKKDHF